MLNCAFAHIHYQASLVVSVVLGLAVLFLAYSNGANDNFKGVASLFGSATTDYRKAILWGTLTTAAGSLAATLLAGELLRKFSGKGLVAESLISQPLFLVAVALGAGGTVLLATRFGFPISTTHGLTGALLGAGLAHDPGTIDFAKIWESFARPLLISPALAVLAGAVIYVLLRTLRLAPAHPAKTLNALHFLSAGAVSFARGLNDTPKIAALALAIPLLGIPLLGIQSSLTIVGLGMALGGWFSAGRVAETMAHKITGMNPAQGFAANLSTALLVTSASLHGLPVSTTHISVGSLLGIGITTSQARWHTVIPVLLSWIVTLPCAAALSGGIFALWRWTGLGSGE